ncbi:potassium transporter [Marinihelvus fidelis]|uniref:Trk system potassium uptake protein n=1 Tax=Marinihelvus fidelis TaxID=2613842 RepID=A0A5N0TDF8_9GAMM|nr:TrkH family potassium uptake protein [Marinihelvus fidelis]KAA9131329.1 potassium transporter [Marinihelvus fidelis]
MKFAAIQRVIGALVAWSSLMMLPPAFVSWIYDDHAAYMFLLAAIVLVVVGGLIWWPVRKDARDLRLRDGFIIVAACWLVLAMVGALPFLLLPQPQMSYVDALFESMSGLTTTGATVLDHIDTLPHGILFYRQQLQWLGGMGIIVLAVAILPMLRVGGMQLFRAETPGPMKDAKLTPRIAETAKALWLLYLGITVTCTLSFWLGGMTLFDAISHAFSTVAIGGFSTHDTSFGYFDSPTLEAIAMVFMIISGMNFALHFSAWRKASAQPYFNDSELKTYAVLLAGFTVLVAFMLVYNGTFGTLGEAVRFGGFQVVSALTTTGFTTTEFHQWQGWIPLALISMAFIGGCAGSTAGGMKVIRLQLLYRHATREIHRLIHPHAVLPVKFGGYRAAESVLDAVTGFFFLFAASTALMTLLLVATGLDLLTAFTAVTACITNLGPGLGDVAYSYASLGDVAKLILSFAMLAGRLEIYTLLVLLTPAFWRD